MIDLHTHTTASDGILGPSELVALAAEKGLSAVAITDHDTLDGVDEAERAGERFGVRVIAGVEISLEYRGPKVGDRPGWMHLLLYFPRPGGPVDQRLSELKRWRAERNLLIVEKLRALGMEISLEEVAAEAGGGQMGRPHFARVLQRKGLVSSYQEAFDKLLSKGGPAYVEKKRLYLPEALELGRREGVVAVLAHPYSLGLDESKLREHLSQWKSQGLDGIEVIYPEHGSNFRDLLSRLARELDLLETGGSDFHGDNKKINLGGGIFGNVSVPDEVLENLIRRRP